MAQVLLEPRPTASDIRFVPPVVADAPSEHPSVLPERGMLIPARLLGSWRRCGRCRVGLTIVNQRGVSSFGVIYLDVI
jgi:hypothetical protein